MNINLISDNENGYDFQTRFREDIKIKKNSRVYLNFAQLSKLNAINITQEQELRVLMTDIFPKFKNDLTPAQISQVVTITPNTYSIEQFQKKINQALQTVIDESPQLYYYSTDYRVTEQMQNKNLRIGYFLEDGSNWKEVDFVPDANNSFGFVFNDDLGLIKNTATSNPPQYDCFAISPTYYYHHFYPEDQQMINNNFIYLESNVNIEDLAGSISFGLISPEFKALNDTGTVKYLGGNTWDPSFLVGTNANTSAYNKSIKSFVSVDIVPTRDPTTGDLTGNVQLRVFQGRTGFNATDPLLKDFNFSTQFTARKELMNGYYNLRNRYATFDQPVKIAFQTYIPVTNNNFTTNERKVYYRIFLTDTNATNLSLADDLVFDSGDPKYDSYFSYNFFNTFPAPANTNQSGSMIPFKIFLSAQEQNQGWSVCKYKEFDKSADTATVNRTIVNSYTIELDSQLARYILPSGGNVNGDAIIGPLYPNTSETYVNEPSFFYSTGLSLDFLNDSYSIIVEELPLKSYKNTETQSNGGYSQHILANIPCPFTINFNNVTKDQNLISTVFTPSFQSYVYMKNQEFTTNHFRIKIINMRTNFPAVELQQSTVNFTIEETEESKD
jgi:hypothetical protein